MNIFISQDLSFVYSKVHVSEIHNSSKFINLKGRMLRLILIAQKRKSLIDTRVGCDFSEDEGEGNPLV